MNPGPHYVPRRIWLRPGVHELGASGALDKRSTLRNLAAHVSGELRDAPTWQFTCSSKTSRPSRPSTYAQLWRAAVRASASSASTPRRRAGALHGRRCRAPPCFLTSPAAQASRQWHAGRPGGAGKSSSQNQMDGHAGCPPTPLARSAWSRRAVRAEIEQRVLSIPPPSRGMTPQTSPSFVSSLSTSRSHRPSRLRASTTEPLAESRQVRALTRARHRVRGRQARRPAWSRQTAPEHPSADLPHAGA